jgi:hypothetical protein
MRIRRSSIFRLSLLFASVMKAVPVGSTYPLDAQAIGIADRHQLEVPLTSWTLANGFIRTRTIRRLSTVSIVYMNEPY